jgi:Predicted membrane protein
MDTNKPQPTITDVLAELDAAGIRQPREVLNYIRGEANPHRTRILAACAAGDRHALANYTARAVLAALQAVGYQGALPASALRALSASETGWAMVHAAAGGSSEITAKLQARITDYLSRAGASAVDQRPAPPRPTQREAPAAQGSGFAAPERRAEPKGHPAPASAPSATPRPAAQRPAYTAAPPRRTDNAGNVRQIGEARMARQGQGSDPENVTEATFDSVKVHGGRAALTLEATQTRRREPTVMIEAAAMLDRTARTYDWKNKIAVQLTPTELQHVTCLMLGLIQEVKFQNHGQEQDKWFSIVRQANEYAGTIKITVGKGSNVYMVQLTPADIGNVIALFVRQAANQLKVDQAVVPHVLRSVAQALTEYGSRSGGSQRRAAS